MEICAVKNCKNTSSQLFKSPKLKTQLKKWKKLLEISKNEFFVCENHFDKQFINVEKYLHEKALPRNISNEITQTSTFCECCLSSISEEHTINQSHQEIYKILFPDASDLNEGFICQYCNDQLLEIADFISFVEEKRKNFNYSVIRKHESDLEETIIEDTVPDIDNEIFIKTEYTKDVQTVDNEETSYTVAELVLDKPIPSIRKKKKVYICELCGVCCLYKDDFIDHVMKEHAVKDEVTNFVNKNNMLDNSLNDDESEIKFINTFSLECDICGEAQETRDSLTEHIKHHLMNKMLKCSECEMIFNNTNLLAIHENTVHKKPIRNCRTNQKNGIQNVGNGLIRHKNRNHGNEVFHNTEEEIDSIHNHLSSLSDINVKCPECNKKIRYLGLKSHRLTTHLNIRDEICEICGKGYSTRHLLVNHMHRVHGDDLELRKTYECDFCGIRCITKLAIRMHMAKHKLNKTAQQCHICLKKLSTGLKYHLIKVHPRGYDNGVRVNVETNMYHCPNCIQKFKGMKRYEMHVNDNICSNFGEYEINSNQNVTVFTKGKFKCNICNSEKNSLVNLRKHLRHYHSGEKKCPICDKSLKSLKSIYKHVKNVHKTTMKAIRDPNAVDSIN